MSQRWRGHDWFYNSKSHRVEFHFLCQKYSLEKVEKYWSKWSIPLIFLSYSFTSIMVSGIGLGICSNNFTTFKKYCVLRLYQVSI